MKNLFFGLIYVMTGSALLAQSNPEKYAATITKADLKKHLTVIAGAEMEGRETATEGQRRAAAYIATQFARIGLLQAPGTTNYRQEFPLFYDSIKQVILMVDNEPLIEGKDYITSAEQSRTGSVKTGEIVFVGYGIKDSSYNDYRGKQVKGKTVLMFAGEPTYNDTLYTISHSTRPSEWSYAIEGLNAKIELAKKRGAAAVLFISPAIEEFRPQDVNESRKTDLYYPYDYEGKRVNYASLSHAAAAQIMGQQKFDALLSKVKAGAPLNNEKLVIKKKIRFLLSKAHIPAKSSNVAGYIEGAVKKDEYLIITAHYDHLGKRGDIIYYGADDNGSGTVSVIELAEAFAKAKAAGNGPKRSVVFMAVSGEEEGLWGSEYYTEHPLFPLRKTTADINIDMIGRIDENHHIADSTNYIYVVGDDKLSSDLKPIVEKVNKSYVKLHLDRRYNDLKDINRFFYRSDHYNFARHGVPVLFYFNGVHADYHLETDTVDKINFSLMAKRSHLIFYTAWAIANGSNILKRDIPSDGIYFPE